MIAAFYSYYITMPNLFKCTLGVKSEMHFLPILCIIYIMCSMCLHALSKYNLLLENINSTCIYNAIIIGWTTFLILLILNTSITYMVGISNIIKVKTLKTVKTVKWQVKKE